MILGVLSATRKLSRNGLLGIVAGVAEARWILSSTAGSETLGKFSTLSDFFNRLPAHRFPPLLSVLPCFEHGTTTVLLQWKAGESSSHEPFLAWLCKPKSPKPA
jgi:hypothetical protein